MSFNKENGFSLAAQKAARLAGKFILGRLGTITKNDIELKHVSDFVTSVDRDSEQLIIKAIKEKFPSHLFLAEESVNEPLSKEHLRDTYRWIIDPLDGTTNYIHEYPAFSVSIALEYKGEIILGVIFDPLRNELFRAETGKGAFLNDKPIRVSQVSSLKDSLITTGFPFRKKELIDAYLLLFKKIFNRVSDIRRAGSAALDLAHLACGRCDGFFEIALSPWDIAAGSILIKEAGGTITDFGGGADYLITGNVIAGVPPVHKEILKEVNAVFKKIIMK